MYYVSVCKKRPRRSVGPENIDEVVGRNVGIIPDDEGHDNTASTSRTGYGLRVDHTKALILDKAFRLVRRIRAEGKLYYYIDRILINSLTVRK